MKITVERCWSGSCWKWRLVAPDHKRFLLSSDEGENWSRAAIRARALLEAEGYRAKRYHFDTTLA